MPDSQTGNPYKPPLEVSASAYSSPPSKTMFWTGWLISAPPVLMLLMSAAMKFAQPAAVVKGMADHGYREDVILGLGVVELACTVLYLIPQTSVLGAILLTGYLGGATATHVRVGELNQALLGAVPFGVLLWLGLYFREPRLRVLLPFRR